MIKSRPNMNKMAISELVGLFLLNCISESICKIDHGLFRDDGLIVIRQASGPESERIRKKISKFSKNNH